MIKLIKKIIKYAIIMVLMLSSSSYALTVNNYNKYCEDGKLLNVEIRFNDVVSKYNKYSHFILGEEYAPTGDPSDPLSNEGDRDIAHLAVESDTTYKIYGELDEEEMDYSFYDLEDVSSSELKVYELNSKIDALRIGNQVQERFGYGKYNLRNGKNLIAFIKFAYEFYKESGEYRVGIKDEKLFKGTNAEGKEICPMEWLDEYAELNSTSAVELENGFEDKFRDCVNKWEYIGNKNLENSDKIFETLEDIYVGLVYLYPALKVLQSKGINLDSLDDDDRAAIFSCAYEVKGMQPITSMDVSIEKLTKKFSKIGAGDLIGALIRDEELSLSVGETIYRYMIEIKHKNNPQNLARWISEYEEIYGEYTPLDADSLDIFMKAYNKAFAEYGSDVSKQTGLDYVFFGYVENPELFESKNSLKKMTEKFANHLKAYFSDSAFIRNKDNANYVAKSYMMAQKMCENTGFLDITDIYASDICLVEHSYGYNSTEVMLSDTQVVSLEGKLEEGDFDTDRDEVLDRDELGTLEDVNISRLLEAYIKYNELDQVEADKLRLNSTVQMYNYISNPVLPDSDFDGRGDLRDRGRALDNSYEMLIDTDVVDSANYDLNVDYRYFFMDNTKYYPELSDMAVLLSNMVTKKGWWGKSWYNKTENLGDTDIQSFMWHYGNEDIEIHDMSSYYDDANVCRYAIGQHDVVLRRGKVNNKVRNVITVAIGEIPEKTAELTANLYGLLGDNEEYSEYHHIGYDITAGRIFEKLLRYTENYNNNQKVFFITGARSAGGVANLLSKKLIDRFGPSSVYGYTFNAVSTINGNMIPEGEKIANLKYAPIMNIYNDDEIMVMFTSEETNMYKYGTNVHMSLSENLTPKVKAAFRYVHGSNYDKDMKSKVVNILNKTFNINLSGYTSRIFAMNKAESRGWDSYTSDEINEYFTKNIHDGMSDEEIENSYNFWSELYKVTTNNSEYDTFMESYAQYNITVLEAIRNIRKDLGNKALDANTDVLPLNNANNHSDNLNVDIKKDFTNSKSYEDTTYSLIDIIKDLGMFYMNTINTHEATEYKDRATILANSENGAKKYFECSNSSGDDGLSEYRCPLLDKLNLNTKKYLVHNTKIFGSDKPNSTNNYDFNLRPYNTGDSCSDFALTIIRILSNGYRGEPTDSYNKKAKDKDLDDYGLYLHNTYSIIMYGIVKGEIKDRHGAVGSLSFERAMERLGWDKEYVTKDMTVEDLDIGDLLISKDHAEFYVGSLYESEYYDIDTGDDRNDWKKSGTKAIYDKYGPARRLSAGDKAEGTFGWGNVHDEFPVESKDERLTYFYKNSDEAYFRHCDCGTKDQNGYHGDGCKYNNEQHQYEIIWRKAQ